jgi:conjugative transfer region lipoprotein (TIGR03751 family)
MPALKTNWSAIVSISLLMLYLLSGCSSTSPNVIPTTGPDTLTVYQNHVAGIKSTTRPLSSNAESDEAVDLETNADPCLRGCRPYQHADKDLVGYTRSAANEINQLFPRLPNPELVIYVFPHINGKGRPIPGYSTSFLLYEKDEYALPGEVAP